MGNHIATTNPTKKQQRFNRHEKMAFEKGYRVIAGKVYNPDGKKLKTTSTTKSNGNYKRFTIVTGSRTNGTRKNRKVLVHRLVAYQRYGDEIYNHECIRHLDSHSRNNMPLNIKPGSYRQNSLDVPGNDRRKFSINASTKKRLFTDEEVEEIRNQHYSYAVTMEKYRITSKGTLHYILNHKYKTTKAA